LENTGPALAEDVMQKLAIINQYFMKNQAGQYTAEINTVIIVCLIWRTRGFNKLILTETNHILSWVAILNILCAFIWQ